MKSYLPLLAVFLAALFLRVPGWFSGDEKSEFLLFQPDEHQHIEIAVSFLKNINSDFYPDWESKPVIYNTQGFGIQIGVVAYIIKLITGTEPGVDTLILIGRILSTFYALLLIWLIYQIGLHFFHSRLAALAGALLLALFDLHVTNSHYAIPANAYLFWTYASIFLMIRFYGRYLGRKPEGEPPWSLNLAIPFTAAMAFAVKFDFLPTVFAATVLSLLFWYQRINLRSLVGYAASYFAFFVLFFYLGTFFNFGWLEVKNAFLTLYRENADVIASDRHLLYNPVLYLAGVTGGTSILVMIVFFITLLSLLLRGKAFGGRITLRWWLYFIVLEFLVLWSMDTPFIRRASIFLPFVAIIAGRGLAGILRGNPARAAWQRYGASSLVIGYTLALTLVSQNNFWMDPRYRARDYLQAIPAGASIHYSPYAYVPGMPSGIRDPEADLLVLHETFYGRYWKFFTTPFQYPPECCEEVYHCRSEEECNFYQQLLSGADDHYELLRVFPTREVFPERRLYKSLFGSFETFLGDVRVYQRSGS